MGAGTVDDHHAGESRWTSGASRFEFGLQNYAAIHAVPAGMKLLGGIPSPTLRAHYAELNGALRAELGRVAQLCLVGPTAAADAHHICSFYVPGCDAKRIASLLDLAGNFQVRAGRLCAHHWFNHYQVPEVVRVSFGIHNTLEEVETYGEVFDSILRHYL